MKRAMLAYALALAPAALAQDAGAPPARERSLSPPPAALAAGTTAGAFAGRRVALVIGNSAYRHTPRLENPRNDATDVGTSLKQLGFEVMQSVDLDKASMDRRIRDFASALEGAEAGVLFYAGHGLQVGGQSYLVPVDAQLTNAAALDFEMVRLDLIQRTMERATRTNLLFLDACRDNPLARNLARAMGTRSAEIGHGLAAIESGVGTLISYSTQPGNIALDGQGRNSPFSAALAKRMGARDEDLASILIDVRNEVIMATQGRQIPWEHSALTARFFFTPLKAQHEPREIELAFWASVKDSGSPALLGTYLERYPSGEFAPIARVLIERYRGEAKAEPALRGEAGLADERQRATLARALQTELQRVGCSPGAVDGEWGARAKGALEQFARATKTGVATDVPTHAALEAVKGRHDRVCPLDCGAGQAEVNGRCVAKAAPPRPASAPARAAARASRQEASKEKEKSGMCWGRNGRVSLTLVPCSDPRAEQRAY
jgi:hypothetical protein